jgi:hypothetical protein
MQSLCPRCHQLLLGPRQASRSPSPPSEDQPPETPRSPLAPVEGQPQGGSSAAGSRQDPTLAEPSPSLPQADPLEPHVVTAFAEIARLKLLISSLVLPQDQEVRDIFLHRISAEKRVITAAQPLDQQITILESVIARKEAQIASRPLWLGGNETLDGHLEGCLRSEIGGLTTVLRQLKQVKLHELHLPHVVLPLPDPQLDLQLQMIAEQSRRMQRMVDTLSAGNAESSILQATPQQAPPTPSSTSSDLPTTPQQVSPSPTRAPNTPIRNRRPELARTAPYTRADLVRVGAPLVRGPQQVPPPPPSSPFTTAQYLRPHSIPGVWTAVPVGAPAPGGASPLSSSQFGHSAPGTPDPPRETGPR